MSDKGGYYMRHCDAIDLVESVQETARRLRENLDNVIRAKAFEEAASDLEGFMAPDDWSDEKKDGAYRMSYIAAEKLRARAAEVQGE